MLKILVSVKRQKRNASVLVTKFAAIIVTIYFHIKIPLKFLVKSLLQCFFTNHWKRKTLNKTTCRTPSSNLRQLYVNYLRAFRLLFRVFQDFLIYLAKCFWSLLHSINLTFELHSLSLFWTFPYIEQIFRSLEPFSLSIPNIYIFVFHFQIPE